MFLKVAFGMAAADGETLQRRDEIISRQKGKQIAYGGCRRDCFAAGGWSRARQMLLRT
jgi:hypothetical protein